MTCDNARFVCKQQENEYNHGVVKSKCKLSILQQFMLNILTFKLRIYKACSRHLHNGNRVYSHIDLYRSNTVTCRFYHKMFL